MKNRRIMRQVLLWTGIILLLCIGLAVHAHKQSEREE